MGIYLSAPNKEKFTITGASKNNNFRYVASGMQGWRVNMEDAHISTPDLIPDCSLFGVFDGHGGQEVAKFVEKHFAEELKQNNNFKLGNIELALKETFLKMDEMLLTKEGRAEIMQIKSQSGENDRFSSEESYAGCTANVALIYKNELYVANAGDSRTVLCINGKAKDMSKDHKPDDDKERERVIKAGGYVSDGRINGNLNLSRALGDLEYKKNTALKANEQLIIAEPDILKVTLTSNDQFIVMGCDGIWEKWSTQEMCDFVSQKISQGKTDKAIIEDLLDSNLAPDTSNTKQQMITRLASGSIPRIQSYNYNILRDANAKLAKEIIPQPKKKNLLVTNVNRIKQLVNQPKENVAILKVAKPINQNPSTNQQINKSNQLTKNENAFILKNVPKAVLSRQSNKENMSLISNQSKTIKKQKTTQYSHVQSKIDTNLKKKTFGSQIINFNNKQFAEDITNSGRIPGITSDKVTIQEQIPLIRKNQINVTQLTQKTEIKNNNNTHSDVFGGNTFISNQKNGSAQNTEILGNQMKFVRRLQAEKVVLYNKNGNSSKQFVCVSDKELQIPVQFNSKIIHHRMDNDCSTDEEQISLAIKSLVSNLKLSLPIIKDVEDEV